MKTLMISTCMAAIAAMLSPAPVLAACPAGQLVCVEDVQTESNTVQKEEIHTTTTGEIRLGWDYDRMSSGEVKAALRGFKGTLPPGNWPLGARAGDHNAGVLVFAKEPAADISIEFLQDGGGEATLLINAYDTVGNQIRLNSDQFAVFDFEENPLPFATSAPTYSMAVKTMLDVSGSMGSSLKGISSAVRKFLGGLPNHVGCSVSTFSHEVRDLTGGFVPCPEASGMIPKLRAGGGTDLYGTTVDGYRELAQINAPGTLLLLVTDGYNGSGIPKSDVIAAKSSPTFALWVSGYNPDGLSGVADFEAIVTDNNATDDQIEAWIEKALDQVGTAIVLQHTLVIQKPAHASN